MRKLIGVIICLLATSSLAYATNNSKVQVQGSINDDTTTLEDSGLITKYFTSGAKQQQSISLTASAFTPLSIPSGAKAVLIDVGSVDGIKLKGVTADTGISMDSTVPILLPISTDGTTTIGFQNMETSTQNLTVYWF